ncbi:MAG: YihY/virulence factor BrkB family protein [Gemmatimonadetes bacterium]|nr:YihY/virulence factor BrkB family protein [Gemmatimonadota bacterium]MBT8403161.1 YihY/virulence factor BrkB family protein [Gemmatimonadota bacterium]NNF38632.1 YihY/virulence factor BrkB family protein [Gemmatimonadota bacterium]NNK63734.1 YihY/virulence factor BrkB family protein [Gemmatimonadota bacterium]
MRSEGDVGSSSAFIRAGEFARRVLQKADEDLIFFMAGAISFNLLVAFVPLLLFAVGASGMVLSAQGIDPTVWVIELLQRTLPATEGDLDLVRTVQDQVGGLLDQRRGFTVVGAALLVWFSTRLVGTLRTALREIFDMPLGRSIVYGKLFDIQVVLIGGVLLLLNVGITAGVRAAEAYGVAALQLEGPAITTLEQLLAQGLAFASIWVLFLGIYRYLPVRPIPWKTALVAATFTAVLHELLKAGFGWYVTEVANYRTTYGNLLTLAVLFFWIYYEAIGFILGGEVAQVWTMRRARRVQVRSVRLEGDEP